MSELDIEGDIDFDETNAEFWKRKFVELYNKLKEGIKWIN